MTLDEQAGLLNVLNEDRELLKQMIDRIYENIAGYPVITQFAFTKFMKNTITEAFKDASNPNDPFLNNHDAGDRIEIS